MRLLLTIIVIDLLIWLVASLDEDVTGWLQSFVDSPQDELETHSRSKRSLFNFQGVIQCFQPWAHVLSLYGDYGCYCGYKGHGRPLDDTDECCYNHDKCYDLAETRAKTFSEMTIGSYFTEYSFDCTDNRVVCRADLNTDYQQSFCDCDRLAGECFITNRKTYASELYNINTEKYCADNANLQDLNINVHTLTKLYTCKLRQDQDRCCVEKGYNTAYQLCCGGKLKTLSQPGREKIRCCGDRWYDPRSRICCYGYLHPNALHMQCCGTSGGKIDERISKCVDGEPVLLQGAGNVTEPATTNPPSEEF